MYGEFRKHLNRKCPLCGRNLQIRTTYEKSLIKGIEVELPTDYVACSKRGCHYTEEIEQHKKR